mmetsp:Transcript_12611/g.53239  ORF Transcript_12611/g.53239 Transcript_12611/m.53239 type:complete len:299 (+) Transcript_12611:1502-2398(+)
MRSTSLVSDCILSEPSIFEVYALAGSPLHESCTSSAGESSGRSVSTWLLPFCQDTGLDASPASVTTNLYTYTPSMGSSMSSLTQLSSVVHLSAGDRRSDHDPMLSCPPTMRTTSPNSTAFLIVNLTFTTCTVSTMLSSSYSDESSIRSSKSASIGDGVTVVNFSAPGCAIGEFSARWLTSGSMTSTSGSAETVCCAAGGFIGSTGGGWNITFGSLDDACDPSKEDGGTVPSMARSSRFTPFLAAISLYRSSMASSEDAGEAPALRSAARSAASSMAASPSTRTPSMGSSLLTPATSPP